MEESVQLSVARGHSSGVCATHVVVLLVCASVDDERGIVVWCKEACAIKQHRKVAHALGASVIQSSEMPGP